MKIALLQFDYHIGNVKNNYLKMMKAVEKIQPQKKVDLIITSELSLVGYPAQDLLFTEKLIDESQYYLAKLAHDLRDHPPILVGLPEANRIDKSTILYNSVALLEHGQSRIISRKKLLPSYEVFNEKRYFNSDDLLIPFTINNHKCIAMICEDWWSITEEYGNKYLDHPINKIDQSNVDLLLNLSASPYTKNKIEKRHHLVKTIAQKFQAAAVYLNQVGYCDELFFDGNSLVYNQFGELVYQAKHAKEDTAVVDLAQKPLLKKQLKQPEQQLQALVFGLKSFAKKNNFKKVVLGLSGGIDSALTLYIAVQALGCNNVDAILMPSRFTSKESTNDAIQLAQNLHVAYQEIKIHQLHALFLETMDSLCLGEKTETAKENIQARIRGILLMAHANTSHAMLLNTGNKSELAVGYCTLYGDMCGGLAVLADLWKSEVFQMARFINLKNEIIPKNIIERAPSAELRENQTDQDSLPPYENLDTILQCYIEKAVKESDLIDHKSIIEKKITQEQITKTLGLFKSAQFKRQQAPPMIVISNRPLNSSWKYPIDSVY